MIKIKKIFDANPNRWLHYNSIYNRYIFNEYFKKYKKIIRDENFDNNLDLFYKFSRNSFGMNIIKKINIKRDLNKDKNQYTWYYYDKESHELGYYSMSLDEGKDKIPDIYNKIYV